MIHQVATSISNSAFCQITLVLINTNFAVGNLQLFVGKKQLNAPSPQLCNRCTAPLILRAKLKWTYKTPAAEAAIGLLRVSDTALYGTVYQCCQ